MRDNILATENQQVIINDVIEVKIGVYLHKTKTNTVNNNKKHADFKQDVEKELFQIGSWNELKDCIFQLPDEIKTV